MQDKHGTYRAIILFSNNKEAGGALLSLVPIERQNKTYKGTANQSGEVEILKVKAGNYDVNKMIGSLEGYKFLGPKGWEAIRPQDHATLQPMFRVQLVKGSNGKLQAKVLGTANSFQTAPPIAAMKG